MKMWGSARRRGKGNGGARRPAPRPAVRVLATGHGGQRWIPVGQPAALTAP